MNRIHSGIYLGSDLRLHGKTALLLGEGKGWVEEDAEDFEPVLAQFDDITTGRGFGWHPFYLSDFANLRYFDEI